MNGGGRILASTSGPRPMPGKGIKRNSFRREIIGHSFTALLLAITAVLLVSSVHDYHVKKEKLMQESTLIADIIGASAAAAVAFEDQRNAKEMLASVKLVEYIDGAVITNLNGEVMASVGNYFCGTSVAAEKPEDSFFGVTEVIRPIRFNDEEFGEVCLRASHTLLREAFFYDVLRSLIALWVAGLVVFSLLYRALRPITKRLSMISSTMADITNRDDYEVRLPEANRKEVKEFAVLASSLNTMLGEISRRSHDLKRELEQRRLNEIELRKLSKAVENSAAGIFVADPQGWIEYANKKYLQMNGFTTEDVAGAPSPLLQPDMIVASTHGDAWAALHAGCEWQGEIRIRRSESDVFWGVLSLAVILDEEGVIAHIVGNLEDISDHKKAEETINRLAFFDPLTKLPNRRSFAERLPEILAHAGHKDELVAIFYLDLDHFKEVNDTLGHGMGDSLLQTAAKRLQSVLRENDVIARLGGDEFALVIPHLRDHADAEVVARKVIDHMTAPFNLDGHELSVTASVGIAFYPEHGHEANDLLKRADIALYRAKAVGRNTFQMFSFGLEEVGLARMELEAQIRNGLEAGEFFLEYQPKMCLNSGKLCGAEALIRWNHPVLGRLSPDKFIPLAEESRLIIPLGNWIINEVLRQQAAWQTEGVLPVPVAVNMSVMQFKNEDLPERFGQALARYSLGADLIELEITESLLMDNPERITKQLAELDAMGVGIAIDDFGTGYSSLGYLKDLPVDVLKIDRSFVHDLDSADDQVITQAIIALAKSLNLQVVAEGVETEEQAAILKELGCDVIQGYIYSKPLGVSDFSHFLQASASGHAETEFTFLI
jgi:diguanylate cyclase (GGDEF)-like protein/PAS domain S-box-containing protein